MRIIGVTQNDMVTRCTQQEVGNPSKFASVTKLTLTSTLTGMIDIAEQASVWPSAVSMTRVTLLLL